MCKSIESKNTNRGTLKLSRAKKIYKWESESNHEKKLQKVFLFSLSPSSVEQQVI